MHRPLIINRARGVVLAYAVEGDRGSIWFLPGGTPSPLRVQDAEGRYAEIQDETVVGTVVRAFAEHGQDGLRLALNRFCDQMDDLLLALLP